MAKLIAGTYGSALFETALEENHIDGLYDEVLSLKEILKENPDFSKLLNHPKLTKEEKEDRKSTRLNSSHPTTSRMPSSA